MKIAILKARYNDVIVSRMLEEARKALFEEGLKEEDVEIFAVPGAFEIPAAAQKIIDSKKFDGMIALGCVIRGETDHYEYICRAVADGIQKVSIENRFPIMFGILTVHSIQQAMARVKKGYECGKGVIEMIRLFERLPQKMSS